MKIKESNILRNKKILLVGLGRLGGGLATAKFLISNGAKLTVTDLKTKKELSGVLVKLKKNTIRFVLGKHEEGEFKKNDIIVFNPAVSIFNRWVTIAKKYKKQIENDLTLFLKILADKNPDFTYIAITGTRGKTTSTYWTAHLLKPSIFGGNIPTAGLFKIISRILRAKKTPIVLELSSFQLEFMDRSVKPPKIAVITNLYNDHLNRYIKMETYAAQKANIFLNQTKDDFLILNYDDPWKRFFLKKRPHGRVLYVSLNNLPVHTDGLFFRSNKIYFQDRGKKEFVTEVRDFSEHQKYNLLVALLASRLYGKNWHELVKRISSLPTVPFRQEIVHNKKGIMAVNDSAATSPDGTIAALERFKTAKKLFLICGGTDKNLDFKDLAAAIKREIPARNLFLLNGSATQKLVKELARLGYFTGEPRMFETLREIVGSISKDIASGLPAPMPRQAGTILFSPAAASFEKFKNEFDRGRKFTALIRKKFK